MGRGVGVVGWSRGGQQQVEDFGAARATRCLWLWEENGIHPCGGTGYSAPAYPI